MYNTNVESVQQGIKNSCGPYINGYNGKKFTTCKNNGKCNQRDGNWEKKQKETLEIKMLK